MGDREAGEEVRLMPVIACLGWGSLIWDRRSLPVRLPWREDGPAVRVEFLRRSRGERITLVLHEQAELVRAYWAVMETPDLPDAIEALRKREGILPENVDLDVGRWPGGKDSSALIGDLPTWAQERGIDAVIWTALGPKFYKHEPKKIASAPVIVEHLLMLPESLRPDAEEYIRYAPAHIDTPVRREIAAALGWTALPTPTMEDAQMENEANDTGKKGASEKSDKESAVSMPKFIADVLAKAREQDGADDGLLDILEKNIVRLEPSSSPIDDALSEIDALADSRATKGDTDGEPDHD